MMLTALIRQEVTWASRAEEWSDGELDHVGDALGRVLGWAWRTDPDRIFMRAITDYVGRLSQVVGRQLTLQDIRPAMSKGLGADQSRDRPGRQGWKRRGDNGKR
jgi:hypothetical protein